MSNCYINIRVRRLHLMWLRGTFIPRIFINKYWKKEWGQVAVLAWPGKKKLS